MFQFYGYAVRTHLHTLGLPTTNGRCAVRIVLPNLLGLPG